MNELTTIELTPPQALLFIEFQKRYDLIELLNNIDAFNLKNGHITIHFDSFGHIAKLEKLETYKPVILHPTAA